MGIERIWLDPNPIISQPIPEDLKHVPYGRQGGDGVYTPFLVDSSGKLQLSIASLQHLNDVIDVSIPSPADGHVLYWDAATSLWKCKAIPPINILTLTFIIDGGGSAISVGEKGHLEIPFACTIKQVTMLADVSGSIVVDIWKDTYANFPPTDADSITSAAPPTITAAQKSQDSALTGWTIAIAADDILAFNVDSAATITRVTISLKVERS